MISNRLHVASVLSLAAMLASGCALDAAEPGAASDEPVASATEATVVAGNTLGHGAKLESGDVIESLSHKLSLSMQTDGNLVLYFSPFGSWSQQLWASNTAGHPGAWATMQDDGNFVVYAPPTCTTIFGTKVCSANALWATGTNPNGEMMVIQDDGNLVVYDTNGNAGWASGTNDMVPDAAHCTSGFCPAGSWWKTCTGEDSDHWVWCEPPCTPTLFSGPSCVYYLDELPDWSRDLPLCSNEDGNLHCTGWTCTWASDPSDCH